MKNISLSILLGLSLLLFLNTASIASDLEISGSAYFQCSLMSKYMEKHGYSFIKEISHKDYLKTNLYAANDAKVIVKDKNNITVGAGTADKEGNFSINVPADESYRIIVRFHGHEFEEAVSYSDAQNVIIDLGYFSSDSVGSWIDAKLDLRR